MLLDKKKCQVYMSNPDLPIDAGCVQLPCNRAMSRELLDTEGVDELHHVQSG